MSDHIVKAKLLAPPAQCGALARPQDVVPLALIHQGLKIHTIEFTVAEQHDPSPLGNQLPHLVHQFDVNSLREMALSSLGYSPHDRQASLLIDQADHERHAATADDASVDYQHQWDVAQTQEQRSGKREEEVLASHRFIAKLSFESFDTALDFRCLTSWPSRDLVGNVGKIRPPAAHDPTDQPRQSVQTTGQMSCRFSGEQRPQGAADGLKSFLLSLMSGSIQCSFGNIH